MHTSKQEFNDRQDRDSKPLILFVLASFFVSGACGLIYEILWSRFLANLIGATSISHVVVLVTFMGGLAIGALVLSRYADRVANGLWFYGWLEIGIGLYACFFFWFYRIAHKGFLAMATGLIPGSPALLGLKFIISFLLIIIPAIAMGATLPAITRYLTQHRPTLRKNIALLYGLNSLGAVLGTLIGGFYLIYTLGLSASMTGTGIINILLGLAALAVAKYGPYQPAAVVPPGTSLIAPSSSEIQYDSATVKLTVIAAGISGMATMGLQVAWIRYFGLILGSTHSAFTIVLAAFITGISIGSLLVSTRLAANRYLPSLLAAAFLVTATTLVASLFYYGRFPFTVGQTLSIIARTPLGWFPYQILRFSICFVFMLVPTIVAGIIFPVCVRIAGQSKDRVARDTGLVYTANTVGAILGILLVSQVFYRFLSFPATLQGILFLFLAGALLTGFALQAKKQKPIFIAIASLAAVHLLFWQPWSSLNHLVGDTNFAETTSFRAFQEYWQQQKVVFEAQDPDVHSLVLEFSDNISRTNTLFINSKPDASDSIDMATQLLLAHIPMLLHPEPHNIFVLGLGSGVTSGEVLHYPSTHKVTTAELAASVFTASKEFAHVNSRYWENPKHLMIIDDAKTFLQLTGDKFDVMIIEPTNVWQNGMAGLFSTDFFQLVKSRLAKGGIVGQWLHGYKIDNRTIEAVLKTFSQVFPTARIFQMDTHDYIIIATDEHWRFNTEQFSGRLQLPEISRSLATIFIHTPEDLLLREMFSQFTFARMTSASTVPVNTDNTPVLEPMAEFGNFLHRDSDFMNTFDSRTDPDARAAQLLLAAFMEDSNMTDEQLQESIN
ncbi:MAG: fused MFS/spermidine synthase, partial [Desulfobulbales bacterium]|nr:fused MFS/spermidine synthase [Desulfobulbales bacterium]